jgi:hypothetical protein
MYAQFAVMSTIEKSRLKNNRQILNVQFAVYPKTNLGWKKLKKAMSGKIQSLHFE